MISELLDFCSRASGRALETNRLDVRLGGIYGLEQIAPLICRSIFERSTSEAQT
jgi:hypothetical protein